MKNIYSIVWTALIVSILMFASCKKETDANTQNAIQANSQSPDLLISKNCLITHYYDDNFITGYTLDISYNSRRQPDTVTINYFGTSHLVAHYDKIGRLSKVTFPDPGLQQYEAFKYDRSLLPTRLLLIVTNYKDYGQTDSVNAIVYYKYNNKGEMVQMKQTNAWYPGNDVTYNYEYDNRGNIKSITHVPESGTAYTEYAFTSYDNKPNFMTGSIWIKYLLIYTGFDPFYHQLFSRNNAKDWMWHNAFQIQGDNESITSTFTYNSEGFANVINMTVIDSVYPDFTATRSTVSTCDNFAAIPGHTSPVKSSIPLNVLKQFNTRLPSPFYDKK